MQKRSSLPTPKKPVTVMGIDPGFASMGVAVLEHLPTGEVVAVRVAVLETAKADKKVLQTIRVASDDQRRLREFWDELSHMLTLHRPAAMGVEQWSPRTGMMGGNAWKVSAAVQLSHCVGWAHGLNPIPFLPMDIKRRFLGTKAGDKNRVGYAMLQAVDGLAPLMAPEAKGKHEHIYDAVGLAYLALEEWHRIRAIAGM
jgi:Holliday junction resolvasome RuvABC endonuclease subunit